MKKLFIIFIFCVWLRPLDIFAVEENVLQECVNNSKAAKSYHIDMYLKDLKDKRTAGKNIHSIDWSIDYVKPNKFSVEQYLNIEKFADKWITIGNDTFRFFNAFWIKSPMETIAEQNTLKFNQAALLNKYVEVISDYKPIKESGEGEMLVLNYSPKKWKSFYEAWGFKNVYSCALTIWINAKNKLIEKAFVQVYAIGRSDEEVNFEMEQTFSNYNSNIIINQPKTINVDEMKWKP